VKQWPAILAGLLFGAGLAFSGMTDPAKILAFLDFFGAWEADLMFVMVGAVTVSLGATPWIINWAKPIFADAFSLPTSKLIDRQLIIGGALFGLGWGLWGYCPGPAIAALAYGYESTLVFCLTMVVGMWLAGRLNTVVSKLES